MLVSPLLQALKGQPKLKDKSRTAQPVAPVVLMWTHVIVVGMDSPCPVVPASPVILPAKPVKKVRAIVLLAIQVVTSKTANVRLALKTV